MRPQVLVLTCLFAVAFASEKEFLSNTLGSGMVLPRAPHAAALWGWIKPGDHVVAHIDGKSFDSTEDAEGYWRLELAPMPAGGPYTITLNTTSGTSTVLDDVLFGDVFFCGGQSNMQMTVDLAFNGTAEIAAANAFPNIRLFNAALKMSNVPLHNLVEVMLPWSRASNTSVGGAAWSHFSATCWYFGKNVHLSTEIPIGLVSSNWGGTDIQPWSSPVALSKCSVNFLEKFAEKSGTILTSKAMFFDGPNDHPSSLWNSMVVPFFNWRFAGFAWYQGENNVNQPKYYSCAFPAMINDWRSNFKLPNVPFLFVQLATWRADLNNIPAIRIAQTAALKLANVGMATAFDLSDATSSQGDIHPRNKSEVGRRLALNAQDMIYHQDVISHGPTIRKWKRVEGDNSTTVTFTFVAKTLAGGLVLNEPMKCPFEAKFCGQVIEIQGKDDKWYPATYQVSRNSFVVKVDGVKDAKSVRYGWADYPLAVLYNKAQLPMTPFVITL